MKSTGIIGSKITTRLWLSFGAILLILAVVLVVYELQVQRIINRVDLVSKVQQPVEQSVWEMRYSNTGIARYVSQYAGDLDPSHVEKLRSSETSFDRAIISFDRLVRTDEGRRQSQELGRLFTELRSSADDVIAAVDRQQAALSSVRIKIKEADTLVEGLLAAAIEDSSSAPAEKLSIALDMRSSLETVSRAIEDYLAKPDPAIRQQVLDAGEDFTRIIGSYHNTALSSLESSWSRYMQEQFAGLTSGGIELFAARDSLNDALVKFNGSVEAMDTVLTGQVQPLVNAEALAATGSLKDSASSAGIWITVLVVIGILSGIATVLVISRRITSPIREIVDGAAVVASGRIEHRFNTEARGEFGQVALSLNKMLDNLKRSRDALGESEELAWALLDATRDAVILTDVRGTVLASNEIAAGRFSRSLEQMIDESVYDLLPAESSASLKAHVAELLRTRKPVHYEDERNGNIIEYDIYPVSGNKGDVSRIAIFSRDVTMRKWVEDVTEQLGRRNALILESAGEGIFGLDIEGRTTFVNPTGARMLGYRPEELTGKKHHDIVHHSRPDGRLYPQEQCPIYAAFKDGTVHSNVDDEVFWRKDGTSFQVEYTSTPIIEDGRIMGAVVTFRDISNRKRVEKALRESEEKYRLIVESAASLIVWLDDHGIVTECNPRVTQFLGYAPTDLVGHPFVEFVHQTDRRHVEEILRQVMSGGSEQDHHFRMVLKEGGFIEVSMNAAIARDTGGSYTRIICMISSVSERVNK